MSTDEILHGVSDFDVSDLIQKQQNSRSFYPEYDKALLTLTRLVFREAAFELPRGVLMKLLDSDTAWTFRQRPGNTLEKSSYVAMNSMFAEELPAPQHFRPEYLADSFRNQIYKIMDADLNIGKSETLIKTYYYCIGTPFAVSARNPKGRHNLYHEVCRVLICKEPK